MNYIVRFAQWVNYEIEADNADEAIEEAEKQYDYYMRRPIANTVWNEMIVENEKGEEIEHGFS